MINRSIFRAIGAGLTLASLAVALPAKAQYPAPGGYGYPNYPAPATGGYPAPSYPAPSYPAPNYPAPATGGYPGYPAPRPTVSATSFICGQSGNDPATLVQVNGRILRSPLIVWSTHYFGAEYTPQQRCQEVSAKLTQVVAQNGGRLSNLRLSTGYVYGQAVVCYLNNASSCDGSNVLFTLKPENARNAPGVLARLANFGRYGSGSAIPESGGGGDAGGDASVSMEEAIDQAVQAEGSPSDPSYPAAPSPQPSGGSSGGI